MATVPTNLPTEHTSLESFKSQLILVGLTGGIGSGKTIVSNQLAKLGAGIVDTDMIAHQITAPGGIAISLIQKQFGSEFISPDGSLDRARMRTLVFKDPTARKALEDITHPLIRDETIKQVQRYAQDQVPYLVFVVPLLIESGSWRSLLDCITVVDCPEEVQIARVMQRSKLTRDEVERILKAQVSREERLACADFVIQNQGNLDHLNAEVLNLHQKILQIPKDRTSSS